ncbi:hypothetical protein BK659_14130 [Pseudomonas brassicacearum]|uniref:Uncharacterized protein n=1 Tax=Pseudomonas brassicacearum TaxID=930166 RepID=A0A423H5N8_9PSED|nr:hypothetical protein [Pseudomonas brassicacearum]RON08522.1 hypothetical protein BK659_14130 [Pseudomonas brassicacearum]
MGKWAAIDLRICTDLRNLPYRAEPEDDIHPMIWLSKEPGRIEEIPELQRDPKLKALVTAINNSGLRFETFSCASQIEGVDGVFCSVFGVGFIYRDRRAFQDYGAQLMVAGEILGFVADSDTFPDQARPFAIEIHRIHLKEENLTGWSVDVWHESRSAHEADVKSQAAKALDFLTSVLGPKSA